MDGLLFDTERLYEAAALSAAAELDCDMDRAFFRSTVGSPWVVNRACILERYGPDFAVDELRARAARIFRELVDAHVPGRASYSAGLFTADAAFLQSVADETVARYCRGGGVTSREP
jgi:beta-phosphoglucomutase-like phosphatase (HAD superfamily)